MPEKIRFLCGDLELEGLLDCQSESRGAVITHPHPLYGGDMYNPVVDTLYRAYAHCGYSTLRFNFRGVGNSSGTHDNGIRERDDLNAAVICLKERGISTIDRAGYSFGTWVSTFAEEKEPLPGNVLMVSPPVAFMDFSGAGRMPQLLGVVCGERDDIAPADGVRQLVDRLNPEAFLRLVPGADHFYSGCLDRLEDTLNGVLALGN